jgi:anti-sigma B factor antagonist
VSWTTDEFYDSSNLGLLQINIVRRPDHVVLVLCGELDLATSGLLGEGFERVTHGAPDRRVVLDLSQLGFMDSCGLHTLSKIGRLMGGRLTVRAGAHRRLFALTALDLSLTLVPEVPEPAALTVGARNITYVRDLYNAWWLGGISAMAARVPDDVEWEPSTGQVLRGRGELLEYWQQAEPTPAAASAWFTAVDHDVIIESEHRLKDGSHKRIFSLYEFAGPELKRAIAVQAALN